MLRKSVGLLMILHGLAHTLAGMRVTDATQWDSAGAGALLWMATATWAAAAVGFAGAGLGLLGAAAFRGWWPALALAGVAGSFLLAGLWRSALALPGVLVTAAMLVMVMRVRRSGRRARAARSTTAPAASHRRPLAEVGR